MGPAVSIEASKDGVKFSCNGDIGNGAVTLRSHTNLDKPELTRRLESLRGGPGFTGDAPGGPSRWSTERSSQWEPLRPELVVEVSFDHVSGGRFRHGTRLIRLRPDKAPAQCRIDQIAVPTAGPLPQA